MKLAHLADIHLGFRQYYRQTPQGINQREADVANAFRRVISDIIEVEPDIVVIAGDFFHSVRPTNLAILHAFNQLQRLRDALPEAPVVIVAGDHDTPRSVETGTILKLFEALGGVHTISRSPQQLEFEHVDLSLMGVPTEALRRGERPTLRAASGAKHNVLVIHTPVAGVLPERAMALQFGGVVLEPSELHPESWSYVALGHFHVAHRVRENAWYSGALDYVGTNPWGELIDEAREGRRGKKGWLLVELEEGKGAAVTFRSIALARNVIDLESIQGAGESAEALDRAIADRVAAVPGGIDDQVVRQVVCDVPRPVARELNYTQVRDFKTRALHYHLDLRRPASHRHVGVGAPGRRQTLPEILTEYLSRRPLEATVDRERLVALGRTYMDEVQREPDED